MNLRIPFSVLLATACALSLGACRLSEPAPATAVAPGQGATIVLKTPREVLADGFNRLTRDDIVHVGLELMKLDAAGAETLVTTLDLKESELGEDVVFSHLHGNARYRIKARAYGAEGTAAADLISADDDRSWTEVQTTSEQAIAIAPLKLKLKSVAPFVRQAFAGHLSGVNGQSLPNALDSIGGVVADQQGYVYFSEPSKHVIRRVLATGGTPEVVAGVYGSEGGTNDLNPLLSLLTSPGPLAVDASGNLYVAETTAIGGRIRRVLAGGGTETLAVGVGAIGGLAVLADGSVLFTEPDNRQIKKLPWNGTTFDSPVLFAGSGSQGHDDGAASTATFVRPKAIAVGPGGAVFVADIESYGGQGSDSIRAIRNGQVEHVKPNVEQDHISNLKTLAVGRAGNLYYVGSGYLQRISRRGNDQDFSVFEYETGADMMMSGVAHMALGGNRTLFLVDPPVNRIWKVQ